MRASEPSTADDTGLKEQAVTRRAFVSFGRLSDGQPGKCTESSSGQPGDFTERPSVRKEPALLAGRRKVTSLVIMVLRDDASLPPQAAGAPRYPATRARRATEFQCPRGVRLAQAIAHDGPVINRYRNPTNFCEHVKRNEEAREASADGGFSEDRFLERLGSRLNVLGVEMIEDLEVLLISSADVSCEDRAVQGSLRSEDIGR